MEHSLNSSMGKATSAKENSSFPDQESGWTSYFEDFSNTQMESSLGGSSLVSDAASCAAWKTANQNHAVSCSSNRVAPNLPKKLSLKKTRTKQISEDDPLEDTASSPVNSPKVGGSNPTQMISCRNSTADQLYDSMGKGFTSEHNLELQTDDKVEEINLNGKKNIDYTQLKKKGLCLVPLSMLVNYFR